MFLLFMSSIASLKSGSNSWRTHITGWSVARASAVNSLMDEQSDGRRRCNSACPKQSLSMSMTKMAGRVIALGACGGLVGSALVVERAEAVARLVDEHRIRQPRPGSRKRHHLLR